MDDMTARMAEQLKNNPALIRSLMQSQDGQTLIRLLTQGDNGAGLQRAVQSATRGNTGEMAQMIQKMMQSPEGAALVERIQRKLPR